MDQRVELTVPETSQRVFTFGVTTDEPAPLSAEALQFCRQVPENIVVIHGGVLAPED